MMKYLLCEDQKACFAVPVEQVSEVIFSLKTSALPHESAPFKGVMNLRGEVLPVLDMDSLLGRSGVPNGMVSLSARKYTIVLLVAAEKFAMHMELVKGIIELDPGDLTNSKVDMQAEGAQVVSQIAKSDKGHILIMNLEHILSVATASEGNPDV